jgi:glycosyltransferase involved in cell wall biosynthesis
LKFSLITPEHNPGNLPYLLELWSTIKSQTYTNWEWVILVNNGCEFDHIPDDIKFHPKVRLYRMNIPNPNIGAIKYDAFMLGEGDVLVDAARVAPFEDISKSFGHVVGVNSVSPGGLRSS